MRVIAGSLGGRQFNSPHGHRTHPMSEKMRGALFATLGDIKGLTFMDAFAGSGAIGFEALSRGAASVYALDSDQMAARTILENAANLGVELTFRRQPVLSWSRAHRKVQFDVIVADPPYDELQYDSVEKLPQHVKPGGLLILSWPSSRELPRFTDNQIQRKEYGDSSLVYFRF